MPHHAPRRTYTTGSRQPLRFTVRGPRCPPPFCPLPSRTCSILAPSYSAVPPPSLPPFASTPCPCGSRASATRFIYSTHHPPPPTTRAPCLPLFSSSRRSTEATRYPSSLLPHSRASPRPSPVSAEGGPRRTRKEELLLPHTTYKTQYAHTPHTPPHTTDHV